MSYLNKQYIATTGHDFTPYVNSEEDEKVFNQMIEHEKRCANVPTKDCIHDVIAAINLGRQLQGIKQKVSVVPDPRLN